MAKPITSRSSQFIIRLGDGGSPETFTAPCGLSTKGITFSKETNEINVPDCDDPEAPAWVERATVSLSATVTGDGILAMNDLDTWIAFNESTASRNAQIDLDVDAPNTAMGGMWTGKFLMTSFAVTAEVGSKLAVAIELTSDGQITFVPSA
jgi:hypothetical protein